MNVKEKILLVQLLLEDIRGNWGYASEVRTLKAKSLCEEIATELNDNDYITLANSCDNYIKSSYECGDWDGRYFRATFPNGYINMETLHGLHFTYNDKSGDFKAVAKEYLTYPEYRFVDWKNKDDGTAVENGKNFDSNGLSEEDLEYLETTRFDLWRSPIARTLRLTSRIIICPICGEKIEFWGSIDEVFGLLPVCPRCGEDLNKLLKRYANEEQTNSKT